MPEKCNCGGEITVSKKFSVYTKIDLPKIVPQVTHYHLERGKCRICLKKQTAALPTGVTKDLLGPRAKAAISTLSGVYGQSKKEVKKYYKTYSTLMLYSTGVISKTEKRGSEKLEATYNDYKRDLISSDYMHMDETTFRNKNKRDWMWVFANKSTALFHLIHLEEEKL